MSFELTVRELARFLHISYETALKDVREYRLSDAAEMWRKAGPKTPEDVDKFYRTQGQYYLYELIPWNYENDVYKSWNAPLLGYRNRKIVELGAGIGTLCIQLAYVGNDVTYCDINPKLKAFAEMRFAERGLLIPTVKSLKGQRDIDIVVANDFFEHIHKDKLPGLLKEIAGCLKDQGFLYHRSNFQQQDIFPMHFDHSAYFTKMARDANLIERPNGDLVKGGESKGVHIGVPCLGEIPDEWFYSFVSLKKPSSLKLSKVSNRPADVARNTIIQELERDWLFLMDADQTFHPGSLDKLMSWDLPIVSGLYFKSPGAPFPHVYKYAYQGNPKDQQGAHFYAPVVNPIAQFLLKHKDKLAGGEALLLPSQRSDLIEVDGIGAGCILVHRRVLDMIEPPWFEYNKGSFVGEDFYFCRKVQAAGFKIFVDPGVICGHKAKGLVGAEHFLHFITSQQFKNENVHPYPYGETVMTEPQKASQ